MRYELRKRKECTHTWKDKEKKRWPYLTVKEAEIKEIDLGTVFADAGAIEKHDGGELHFNGRIMPLQEQKRVLEHGEKVVGYIPCVNEQQEEGYIRILRKSKKWLAILLALLLMIGCLLGGWYWLNRNEGVDLDKSAISYQMPNGMKNENPEEIMMPVFSELKMAKGSDEIAVGLVNPEGNPCYFKYSILLKEDNKKLYESKWIEPGNAVVEIKLTQTLKTGSYPIIIKIDTGSLDDVETALNGGEIDAVLKVE